MGLFSSKKTYVSTSVSRLIDDDSVPESLKSAMIQALIGRENVSDAILENQVNSSVFKFEQMYRQAERGDYIYGLPSARQVSEPAAIPIAELVLQDVIGTGVSVDYLKIGEPIPKHFGYQHIFDNYGFNRNNGELETLSAEKGTPVYFEKMMTYIPVDSFDDIDYSIVTREIDIEHNEYGIRTQTQLNQDRWNALKDIPYIQTSKDVTYLTDADAVLSVAIYYLWEETDAEGNKYRTGDVITIPIPDSTETDPKEYYHIGYNTISGDYGYWTYKIGSGTYPGLDNFTEVQYSAGGTYFPFAIFISQYNNRALQTGTDAFKSTESLLKRINVDYKELGESLEENPDIADVIQSALVMAVPMNTGNAMEAKYLYDYFKRLQTSTTNEAVTLNNQYNRGITNGNAITWADLDFSLTLSYAGIYESTKNGVLGEPGHYQVDISEEELTYTTTHGKNDNERTNYVRYNNYHIKKQLTANLYSEIKVTNPVAKYDIDYKRSYESTRDNSILLVPLDYLICKTYTINEREELYHRSLHLVFNAKKVVKLKWYETSFFKFVMVVVAIAITVFSFGQLAPVGKAIIALVNLGLTYLAIAAIIVYISVVALKIYAFRLLAKELDPEVLAIISVALIIYGGYQGFAGNALTADNYMALASNMMSASTYALEQDLKAITDENTELSALKSEKEKEIEEALELLEMNTFLDPMAFIGQKPRIVEGESPDDFFARTIHTGSTVELSYKSIEHYVDVSLRLPGKE